MGTVEVPVVGLIIVGFVVIVIVAVALTAGFARMAYGHYCNGCIDGYKFATNPKANNVTSCRRVLAFLRHRWERLNQDIPHEDIQYARKWERYIPRKIQEWTERSR